MEAGAARVGFLEMWWEVALTLRTTWMLSSQCHAHALPSLSSNLPPDKWAPQRLGREKKKFIAPL